MTWISSLALLTLASHVAQAQDTLPTIRTETRAVQIDVAVRDSHGAPVRGLTEDDFKLLDDGKPRPIAFFSAESVEPARGANPPGEASSASSIARPPASQTRALSNAARPNAPHERATVILFDVSSPTLDTTTVGMGSGLMAEARQQVFDVMAQLPAQESIAVYQIGPGGLTIVQAFTTDRDLLRQSVGAWSIPVDWKPICGATRTGSPDHLGPGMQIQPRRAPDPSGVPDPINFGCGVVLVHDVRVGALSALDSLRIIGEKLAGLPGRKNLIWITPGFPTRIRDLDDKSKEAVIAQLNDADVALNAIDVRGLSAGGIDDQGRLMQTMTEPTGGKAYFGNDIAAAIRESDEQARTDYTLGFYLADNERDGNFHKLELRADRSQLSLSYRKGYVAEKVSAGKPAKEAPATELLSPVDDAAIGISGTVDVTPGEPHPTLHLNLSLDPHGLTIRPQDNGLELKFTRMFAEVDARGTTLVEGQDLKELVVPTESLDAVYREKIHWEQALPLMPGAATVRVIVRDEKTGQTGTLTVPVPHAP
jgi:VWFA-related protein